MARGDRGIEQAHHSDLVEDHQFRIHRGDILLGHNTATLRQWVFSILFVSLSLFSFRAVFLLLGAPQSACPIDPLSRSLTLDPV